MTLLPIGQFAKASRLSVKSLRNYHESGLLPAAFVHPESNYRYYRLEQLVRADAIRSLRMVDMPLPQIKELLAIENPENILTAHLQDLQYQQEKLTRKTKQLQRQIQQKAYTMSTTITIKKKSAITAATYRTKTTHTDIFNDIPKGFATILQDLTEKSVTPIGAPFTLYYQAPDGDTPGDIAMCIPVDESIQDDTDIVTIQIPEYSAATLIHQGSYEDMGESYATLLTWIQEHGHQIVGQTQEIYLNSPAEVSEEELQTEFVFPIDAEGQKS